MPQRRSKALLYPILITAAVTSLLNAQAPSLTTALTSLLIHLPLYIYCIKYCNLHAFSTSFLHEIYRRTAVSQGVFIRLLLPQVSAWLFTNFVATFPDLAGQISSLLTPVTDRLLGHGEPFHPFFLPFAIMSYVVKKVSSSQVNVGDDFEGMMAISNPNSLFDMLDVVKATASQIATKVMTHEIRSVSLFFVFPTEVVKVLLLEEFIKYYQQNNVPPHRVYHILNISLVMGMAIANVQAASSTRHEFTPGVNNLGMYLTIAVCTYAAAIISCATLATRKAESLVLRQKKAVWDVRVLSFVFCLTVDLLAFFSTWTMLEGGVRVKACGTLVAVVLSAGLFVWLWDRRILADEAAMREREHRRQQRLECLTSYIR